MAKLLEANSIAARIKDNIIQDISVLGFKPVLASIVVGQNPGALAYARSQDKSAAQLGIDYKLYNLKDDISEKSLFEIIHKLNRDKSVNGIMIQMPLPKQIIWKDVIEEIHPEKDVEGMHPENIGRVLLKDARIVPCTAASVMELLGSTGVNLEGKDAVVVGHSEIVGKPLAFLLLDKLATVTVAHIGTSKAGKLEEHLKRAEILVVAVGCPGLIKGDSIRPGAIVIDVGINRLDNGKIVGDVEFDPARERASYITPVPGGVGPLTVTMLMRNLVEAAKLQR